MGLLFLLNFISNLLLLSLLFSALLLLLLVFLALLVTLHSSDLLFLMLGGNTLNRLYAVSELAEFSNEETIHVVCVGVHSLAEFGRRVESLFTLLADTGVSDFKAGLNQLNIPVVKSVVDDSFVLFH